MSYVPKSKRDGKLLVSVIREDSKAKAYCDLNSHFWRPVVDITRDPSLWEWTCSSCGFTTNTTPATAIPRITLRELENMVDSSCRMADKVVEDNQTVHGELWLMRSALWVYWPFNFHCVYHILKGVPFIMLFRYKLVKTDASLEGLWLPMNDTATYRSRLIDADKIRTHRNKQGL